MNENERINDYFENDFSNYMSLKKDLDCKEIDGITKSESLYCKITGRAHLDFFSNAFFISYYIPKNNINLVNLINIILNPQTITSFKNDIHVSGGLFFENQMSFANMQFTNLIYIYSEIDFTEEEKKIYYGEAAIRGLVLMIRDSSYTNKRNELAQPRAFVLHDSRDKPTLVRPLCEKLTKRLCTVWYDEYSLKVGDSLREGIEDGIKKCKKCIVVLSPNLLSNKGWTKKEFNSIFQREILEGKRLILPIWHNVTKEQVFDYCPSLLDVVALNFSDGIDAIENKIFQKLMFDK